MRNEDFTGLNPEGQDYKCIKDIESYLNIDKATLGELVAAERMACAEGKPFTVVKRDTITNLLDSLELTSAGFKQITELIRDEIVDVYGKGVLVGLDDPSNPDWHDFFARYPELEAVRKDVVDIIFMLDFVRQNREQGHPITKSLGAIGNSVAGLDRFKRDQ